MTRSSTRTFHVVPSASGRWAVKSPTGRTTKVFETQAAAVKAAQAAVRVTGGELQVRDPNGQIKKSFTLGRAAMAKLNAVEGVALTPAAKKAFKDFDRDGLSPTQRRTQLRENVVQLATPPKARAKSNGSARSKPASSPKA